MTFKYSTYLLIAHYPELAQELVAAELKGLFLRVTHDDGSSVYVTRFEEEENVSEVAEKTIEI